MLNIDEIKQIIQHQNLNSTFNNKFDIELLNKDLQKEISKDLCSNIVAYKLFFYF